MKKLIRPLSAVVRARASIASGPLLLTATLVLGLLVSNPPAYAQELRQSGMSASAVSAQSDAPGGAYTSELVAQRVSASSSIGGLGDDLFGEKNDWYSGSSSFAIADVSLPGNSGLPVAVGRVHHVGTQGPVSLGLFGNWDLDVPHLVGSFGILDGWAAAPCSAKSAPPDIWVNGGPFFLGRYYWGGNRLHIPGAGGGLMLLPRAGLQAPQDGRSYSWTTVDNWHFSCVPLKRGRGEGFLAISPDGVRYYFDISFYREEMPLLKTWFRMTAGYKEYPLYIMYRRREFLYPSRVEDRHGNWVNYNWDMSGSNDARLHSIEANDGRRIDIKYKWIEPSGYIDPITKENGYKVESVTANGRAWTYEYNERALLTKVVLPDQSSWKLSPTFAYPVVADGRNSDPCNGTNWSAGSFEYAMTHPSGAQGKFHYRTAAHGRANVSPKCDWDVDRRQDKNFSSGKFFMTVSLVKKELSGPGLSTRTWNVERSNPAGDASWLGENQGDTVKTVSITGPGTYTRYTFSNYFGRDEGKLLKEEKGGSATGILSVTEHTYDVDPLNPAYVRYVGASPWYQGINPLDGRLTPLRSAQTKQDGRIFTTTIEEYDPFARPIKIRRSSELVSQVTPPPPTPDPGPGPGPIDPPPCSGCEVQ